MPSFRKPSPARSQGAISTPRREKPRRTRSVGSPANSEASARLSSIIQEHRDKNMGSNVSPLVRKSVLTDNTDVEEPTRKSWWKKLDDNSRDVMEVLEDGKGIEFENIVEELGIELQRPENKNYSLGLPDSSDNESIKSMVLPPQRKLFSAKENVPQKKFGDFGTRETLDKLYKANVGDNIVNTVTKGLLQSQPRSKPVFPAALLNISPSSTASDKTLTDLEPRAQVRNIFNNRRSTKRKNMFANFIASESEEEISEIQPKVFQFQKSKAKRCPSSLSRGIRDTSPTSSVTTDMEFDDWKLLPSSTLVETELDFMIASSQTPKKARLCKLSEGKESDAGTSSVQPAENKTIQSNKSTLSKDKSKTTTKEKSELDSSTSTRNKSKKPQNEEMVVNISQDQNKSQPTILINNDSKVSQSSISTRSRNKSSLVDAKKNTSINKSRNNASKIKNAINNSLSETRDKATDINISILVDKNSSKICSVSQIQNDIVQNNGNLVKVGNNEMIAQNEEEEEEELNFTLEYEDNANNDEIGVVNNTLQHNSSIRDKSNKILVSKNTPNKDNANNSISRMTNKVIEDTLGVVNQDHFNVNNAEENNCLQNETLCKDTIDNGNNKEINHGAKINDFRSQQDKINNKERLGNKSQNVQDGQNNETDVEEINQNMFVNVSQKADIKSQAKNNEMEQKEKSHEKTDELENDIESSENQNQNQDIEHDIDQGVENHYISKDEKQQNKSEEKLKGGQDELNENQEEINIEKDPNIQEDLNEDHEKLTERQNELNEIQEENESGREANIQEEQNESPEKYSESQDKLNESDREPSIQEEQNESQEEYTESQDKLNESDKESNEEEVEEEDISQENPDESQEERNDSEKELSKSQEIEDEIEEEHHESQETENETQEQEIESEAENEDAEENESENEPQNFNQDESEEDDQEIECDASNESVDNATAPEIDQDENQEKYEAECDGNEIPASPNASHDTMGRNREKHESPEIILHDTPNQNESFSVPGRNTSITKSKTMIRNLNVRPSFAPDRESLGLSDGTKNSSAEGSGWDSHRTTRKTLRQTFGKDFTPRKSLRALVMEKSAKRQTDANDITSMTAKFPLANSTEFPDETDHRNDIEMNNESQPSDHEASRQMRQTTLEMYLQKIKQQNMENRIKMDEAVKNSLKVAPPKDIFNLFKVPARSMFPRKTITKTKKPKGKPRNSFLKLDDLPDEVKEDMKYKPPKRFQPNNAAWITKRLYKFLETKLEPKYDYKARVRAEKLVENLYNFAKECRRRDVASTDSVDVLKHEFARLNIVKTHSEFYDFIYEFMPREIRIKVIPDVVNKIPPPRRGFFSDIL